MTQIHVAIDKALVDELKQLIIELSNRGEIRVTEDGRYSVLDVIKNAIDKKNPRNIWNRLKQRGTNGCPVVQDLDNHAFTDRGNRPTPVATLDVCIEIIYLLPGELPDKMRCLSGKAMAQAVFQSTDAVESQAMTISSEEVKALTQAVTQLVDCVNRQSSLMASMFAQAMGTLAQVQKPALPPSPVPVQPAPIAVAKDSVENPAHKQLIDDVVDERVACGYSKMWVKHALANHSRSKHLTKSDWLYCAKKLGYKPGWGYYCFNETKHGTIKLVK